MLWQVDDKERKLKMSSSLLRRDLCFLFFKVQLGQCIMLIKIKKKPGLNPAFSFLISKSKQNIFSYRAE